MTQQSVLIVEDDPFVRESIEAILDTEGYRLTFAHSASEGRDALKSADDFHVVILDLWLPEENGLNILTEIRQTSPNLPVVVISGGGPGRSLEQAIAMADVKGATSVVIKPFQNSELLGAVSKALS